ncbi:MAG TPA: peptidoglycan DD-metalloendopeptidase family protein [Isosphaeraceae bacterium]|nr:peptidoglycan DD-metalloendopeptidase family protein [Isosphaeraceae bacterium]
MRRVILALGGILAAGFPMFAATPPEPTRTPRLRVVDLDVDEAQNIVLCDGKRATVKLRKVNEVRDPINHSVRQPEVELEVNGKPITLVAGNYRLPVEVGGVQVDCSITGGYRANTTIDHWGLVKAARVRLWPAGSPWFEPGALVYPAKQRWFASSTQMANEPVHVDGGERPGDHKIYYHSGLDIGGAEGLTPVVSATDGLVVSAGKIAVPGYEDTPVEPRYDVVYILDDQGWYYRYSHLFSIDAAMTPGAIVKKGQPLGILGKEGGSGGWSHLHFEIVSRQPSGKWGTQEGYAFLWQAYLEEYKPEILAVARPHQVAWVGEKVTIDGSRSWAKDGPIENIGWATWGQEERAIGGDLLHFLVAFEKPGVYGINLRVTDRAGHSSYDFAPVQVYDRDHPERLPPSIHAAFYPTMGIQPGDPVTFKVRTFRTTAGEETWDFGDGTEKVRVKSDGNAQPLAKDGYAVTVHKFAKAGDYLVHVDRANERNEAAEAWLHVRIE